MDLERDIFRLALRLLSQREYSRYELFSKLNRWVLTHAGSTPQLTEDSSCLTENKNTTTVLNQVLDKLETKGFLSDARAAESLVRRKSDTLGVARVRAELQSKGLNRSIIESSIDDLKATELERARSLWLRKFGHAPKDSASQAKQVRFLAYRGFALDTIRRVIFSQYPHTEYDHEDC